MREGSFFIIFMVIIFLGYYFGGDEARTEMIILMAIIAVVSSFLGWLFSLRSKAKKYDKLKPRLDNLDDYKHELDLKNDELIKQQFEWEKKVQSDRKNIEILAQEKSKGFPWLAKAFAEYYYLQKLKEADYLEHKSHPAPSQPKEFVK